jgi:hypothetical protein
MVTAWIFLGSQEGGRGAGVSGTDAAVSARVAIASGGPTSAVAIGTTAPLVREALGLEEIGAVCGCS